MRIVLASGAWWDIKDTLTWGTKKALVNADGTMAVDTMLLACTTAWSHPEPISQEALDGRNGDEVEHVLERMLDLYGLRPSPQDDEAKKGSPTP